MMNKAIQTATIKAAQSHRVAFVHLKVGQPQDQAESYVIAFVAKEVSEDGTPLALLAWVNPDGDVTAIEQ